MSVKYEEDFLARQKFEKDIAHARNLIAGVEKCITLVVSNPDKAVGMLLDHKYLLQGDLVSMLRDQLSLEQDTGDNLAGCIRGRAEAMERRKEK